MIERERLQQGALTALACLVLGAPAFASHINPINVRPVPVNTPSSSGTDLQTVVNDIFTGVDVKTDQSAAGMWTIPTQSPGTFTASLVYTTGDTSDEFGIFFGTDTTAIDTVPLFLPGAPASTNPSIATRAQVAISNGSMLISSLNGGCGTTVNCGTVANPLITQFDFGFFLTNTQRETFWTVDELNASGAPGELSFVEVPESDWAFAFDNGTASPGDFNNYVVETGTGKLVPTPQPEPGTLLLFGTTILLLAGAGRRRRLWHLTGTRRS